MCSLQAEENHLASMAVAPSAQETSSIVTLFDISWQDVLIPMVTEFLSLKDLFNLRCCSQTAKRFVEATFERRKDINLAGNNSRNIELAFTVLGKCCRRVENLYLARCHWLTDEYLLPILAENTRLRIVNLNECVNITPLALQPIIIECKELRILKLSKCQWLTTGAVDALTLHHSNLVEFDISHCTAIGERCLIIFFRKLNKLNVLSLANTPSVTDQVLIQIANYCRALEHINLVGCAAISDYGIHAIATHCTQLRSLLVQRCPRVTERSLAPLRKRAYVDRQSQLDMYLNDFYPSDFLIY
ncbi:F-box/LRR-repeat protein 15 isoform X2 [Rhagoletis pomonella]|uniref:F-box/LRR-repeat protein 15 isoform X2 n=1 Tax=Rhagoletis pomonella TaxID=28610 RepID=UPI00177ED6C5|nr:F-box/LRR-repeat protein 15 isoform X2 [Rhagoletis pomonella]